MTDQYDYVVVGSGFGGSVAAMRLAEKGYRVAVIEKGKRYESKDFPTSNWNLRKYLWAPLIRCFGFQKLTLFREAFILSGVGVGGGSLVYANTLMQPGESFYANKAWSHLNDWQRILPPYYDKARYMLGVTRNTMTNIADQVLHEVAKDMGRESTYQTVDVGVYFGPEDRDTDPYFDGKGPLRRGCVACAGCMVGCRYNAKNTLDKNYLYFAQQYGAEIFAETKVEKIEYNQDVYHIHTADSTSLIRGRKRVFTSKGLVISGGVLGTLDLLFKQKFKYKTLPQLSERLGENLLTNSESLCGISNIPFKVNHGIAISSIFEADEHTHIEIVKYPDKSNLLKLMSTLAVGPGNAWIRTAKLLFNIFRRPITYLKMMFASGWSTHSVILLVMQSLDNSMIMGYSRISGLKIINKGNQKVPAYISKGQEVMHRYAAKTGGVAANAITEVVLNTSTTAHIMGGCPMGHDEETGVVNHRFEVFGYPNMYILDGSVIPCNLGVNPSLTITALSEYAMSCIAEKTL